MIGIINFQYIFLLAGVHEQFFVHQTPCSKMLELFKIGICVVWLNQFYLRNKQQF